MKRLVTTILLMLFCVNSLDCTCFASAAGREFNEADAALNAAYQSVLVTIIDSQQHSLFVAAQKAWIKYRDDSVAFFAAQYPYSKGGLFYNIHLIRERTSFLKSLLSTPPTQDPEGIKPSGYLQ
jgi:uncharacterized protein YecT (DUF1311 family)